MTPEKERKSIKVQMKKRREEIEKEFQMEKERLNIFSSKMEDLLKQSIMGPSADAELIKWMCKELISLHEGIKDNYTITVADGLLEDCIVDAIADIYDKLDDKSNISELEGMKSEMNTLKLQAKNKIKARKKLEKTFTTEFETIKHLLETTKEFQNENK